MSSFLRASSQLDTEARYAMMDEKKRKRMQSNRESARRSRLKREQRMKDLGNEIAILKEHILHNTRVYNDLTQRTRALLSENDGLTSEKMTLTQYLNNLRSVYMSFTHKQTQTACFSDQPWQVKGLKQPIITTGMSRF